MGSRAICLILTGDTVMFEQELNLYWKTVVDTILDGMMIVEINGAVVPVKKRV